MSAPLRPDVARAIYRSLLNACHNGRHPEVFAGQAAMAWAATAAEAKGSGHHFLFDAVSVRSALREMFATSGTSMTAPLPAPFDALRDANERSRTLLPEVKGLPATLPVFDYDRAAVLPGEETTFRFFEPRYRRLVDVATSADADGWFLLRMLPYSCVLLRIEDQANLSNGDIAVQCVCGPRACVLIEDLEEVGVGLPPLAWAAEYEMVHDDSGSFSSLTIIEEEDVSAMRLHCLGLLAEATTLENVASIGVPPIEPEAFSFFALRFALHNHDVSSRMKWLACRSTVRRLQYMIDLLENFCDASKR